jgi:hypothetical protein
VYDATPQKTVSVTVAGSGETHEIVFGNAMPGKISGKKVIDYDADGVIDAGDICNPADAVNKAGCAGVTVNLTGTDGMGAAVSRSTTTNSSGYFEFLNVWPGTYAVEIVEPSGFNCSYPVAGACKYTGIVIKSGDAVDLDKKKTGDAAFADWKPGSKSGYKFHDLDVDGVWDKGTGPGAEPGIPGWTINLSGAASASTTTGTGGFYQFTNLKPGTYKVAEVCPTGQDWRQSLPASTSSNPKEALPADCGKGVYNFTVISGQAHINNDFGNWQPAQIRAYKCIDENKNGLCDTGEFAFPGIQICVSDDGTLDPAGDLCALTADGSGALAKGVVEFSGLVPGGYTIYEPGGQGFECQGGVDENGAQYANCQIPVSLVSGAVSGGVGLIPTNQFGNVPLEGCTPGYWKQSQHFGSWTSPYSPVNPFTQIDDAIAFPFLSNGTCAVAGPVKLDSGGELADVCDATLLQGIEFNGGDAFALLRHGSAALLNAAHPDVAFGYAPSDIQCIVQAGLGLGGACSGDYDLASALKLIVDANESKWTGEHNCPLGNDPLF